MNSSRIVLESFNVLPWSCDKWANVTFSFISIESLLFLSISWSKVVLPVPFAPIIASLSFSKTLKEIPEKMEQYLNQYSYDWYLEKYTKENV